MKIETTIHTATYCHSPVPISKSYGIMLIPCGRCIGCKGKL